MRVEMRTKSYKAHRGPPRPLKAIRRDPWPEDYRCAACACRLPGDVGDWVLVPVGEAFALACSAACAREIEAAAAEASP